MAKQPTTTCNREPVQASLRIWLDPIPRSPAGNGALPPGIEPPPAQPPGPETHALHLELTLINTSLDPQTAQVTAWSWSQGDQSHTAAWELQPDLSPLNRYNYVHRQPVELHGDQAVTATVDLDINGQPCHLQVQTRP